MKNIRYYIFWMLDFLNGSPVYKNFKEIETIFHDRNEKTELQQNNLSAILDYAVTNTRYYSSCNLHNINSFPVISKPDIIDNMDDMFSKEYIDKKEMLKTMSTSGSTGTPLKIYQDPDKVRRNKADVLFFFKIGGYNVGDRMYYMRIWTKHNKKSKLERIKENFRMFNTSNLNTVGSRKFINVMSYDKSSKVILAYASSFTALIDNLENEGISNWNVKSIFTGSEELPTNVKKKMEKVFKCPVMSRYSNQENGMIGQQPITGEDYFELNDASYHIEFLKLNSNAPAAEMEEARIVVTDLFNKAMPLIRYDTGDIGIYSYKQNTLGNTKRILHSIKGRKNDYLYSNNKEKLAPQVFSVLMWEYNCFKQYQLIQEDYDKIILKLVYKENSDKSIVEARIKKDISRIFGKSTQIKIVELKDIPISESGKRRYIISKIKA